MMLIAAGERRGIEERARCRGCGACGIFSVFNVKLWV